jgi:hypothetical protein
MATHIFTRPLLCYAAEESASWEHCQLAEQLREQLQGSIPSSLLPPFPPSPSHLCAVKISQLAICEEVNSAGIRLAWGVGGYLCIYCMGFSFLFFPLSLMQYSVTVHCTVMCRPNLSDSAMWFLTYLILYWIQHCLKIFFTTLCITTNNDIRSKINNSSVHSRWG